MIRVTRWLVAPLAVLAVAACEDGAGPEGEVPLTLSFAVAPPGGLASLADGTASTIAADASQLELDAVVLGIEELVLEHEDGDGGADSDGDSEIDSDSDGAANEKFAVEGTTVSLPVGGGIITPFSEPVPAGLYEELELDIFEIQFIGTADGEAFDVTVPVDLELEMEFEPGLEVVAGEPLNVTVTVDPMVWFENEDGTFLDPRELSTDEAALNRLRQRMALSFEAFEDSDGDADQEDSDSDSD